VAILGSASATYLDSFPIFRTANAEDVRDVVTSQLGARSFEWPSGVGDFYAYGNHFQFGHVKLAYCSYGAPVQMRFAASGLIEQRFCLHGAGSVKANGNEAICLRQDQSCITPAGRDSVIDCGPSLRQLVLKIDTAALLRKLSALVGLALPRHIDFEEAVNLNHRQAQNFSRLIKLLAEQFDATHASLPDVVLEELQDTIMVAFLSCNPHRLSRVFLESPQDSAPWQVKRIEDYIEAHWNEPITIESLTAIVNASARSIFKSFQKARGYSPMAFAKRVRLKHARTMLMFPNVTTSVTGVAFSCGFHNLGHFANDYRKAFGELPSATLGQNKHL
jgi:AraC-like DNA-binding protein